MEEDAMIGEVVDPRGRRVVLLERIWRGKIQRDHPEVGQHLGAVLGTVVAPDRIEPDPAYDDRTRFFARNVGPSRWLLVVVSYEQSPARIVSAFGNRKDPRSWTA